MPYFPPNTERPLPDHLDEPSNDWGTPYNQPAGTPDLVRSTGLDTQPALSMIEMFNYLLRFYHSHTPAPFVGPTHNLPIQAPGLNSTNLGSLPQEDRSNSMAAGFNEPSMQSQIANLHGFNQALPDIDPSTQDPIPIPAQGLEPQPAPQTPQPAPRRCGRNARSRPRPYERRHDNEQSTGVFRCEWKNCGQTFSRKGDRNRHVNTKHLSPGSNKCPHCERTFNRRDNLRQHLSNVNRGGNNRSSARGVLE